jgi:hypothetical protein
MVIAGKFDPAGYGMSDPGLKFARSGGKTLNVY